MSTEFTWVWMLLALFLVVGLVVHERTGSRLGGVLVLPLLLVYALIDLSILVVFGVGAIFSFLVGGFFYSRLLYYGRRLLYVFLLAGLASSFVLVPFVKPDVGTIIMALLPGLFAYNLHREGRFLEGISTFMIWFGIMLSSVTVVVWLATEPEAWGKIASGTDSALGTVQAWTAAVSPTLAARIGVFTESATAWAGSGLSWVSFVWHGSIMPGWDTLTWTARSLFDSTAGWATVSGVTLVSVAAAHGADGGVE